MEEVVIVRYSEIAVKGPSTRSRMESLLVSNILDALSTSQALGKPTVHPGRIIIERPSPTASTVARITARVFGVKSSSPAVTYTFSSLDDLIEKATGWFASRVKGKVFRVRARRVGSHDFTSKDVERLLGARLLEAGASRVDLEAPEYTAYVEIRDRKAFLYDEIIKGPGGLPLGGEDSVLVLYSGGFDSTVAAWLSMRRGSPVSLAYYDLGVDEALIVAVEAAVFLAENWAYGHDIAFIRVDFKPVMEAASLIRPEYRALVVRRLMLEHASRLARDLGVEALVTGENVGQVATQTIRNLRLIGSNLPLPVIRPVAGMDKDEIVEYARRIGIYDIVAKQVEVCGRTSTPTPRANENVFREEVSKARNALGNVRVTVIHGLRGRSAENVVKQLLRGTGSS